MQINRKKFNVAYSSCQWNSWSGTDDNDIARKVLSYIPDDFSGNLLDVPVGTAVFTERKWKSLKNAQITCLDYSVDMLEQARKRLDGQAHIKCVQGDVGNLQMDNESFNIVVSMNGMLFHVIFTLVYKAAPL